MLFAENTFNGEQILLAQQNRPLSTTCSRLDWITFSLYCYRYTDHQRLFRNQIRGLRTSGAGYEDVERAIYANFGREQTLYYLNHS